MNKTMTSLLLGVTSGMFINGLNLLFNILPYYNVSSFMFRLIFSVLLLAGITISVFTLLFRNLSVCQAGLRWFFMFTSFILFFLISAHVGTVRFLHRFLKINVNSAADNVSGLLSLSFIFAVFAAGLITVIIIAIVKFSKKISFKRSGL